MNAPPDNWIESEANSAPCDDSGICPSCLKPIDDGCECSERETFEDQKENYLSEKGEDIYQRNLDE